MAQLTGQVIVTTYGEQQLLSGTFDVTKIKLGSGIWAPIPTSTALLTQEADLVASGSVISEGANGYRLHVTGTDSSVNAYNLHEFALTDNTDVALAIYSQAAIIATKASGSDLLFSADFVIENAPPGSITISGATTYDLPIASVDRKGIIEIATDAEADAGTDTTRAVTPVQLVNVAPKYQGFLETGSSPAVLWEKGNTVTLVDPGSDSIWLDFLTPIPPSTVAGGIFMISNDTVNPSGLSWSGGWNTTQRLILRPVLSDGGAYPPWSGANTPRFRIVIF